MRYSTILARSGYIIKNKTVTESQIHFLSVIAFSFSFKLLSITFNCDISEYASVFCFISSYSISTPTFCSSLFSCYISSILSISINRQSYSLNQEPPQNATSSRSKHSLDFPLNQKLKSSRYTSRNILFLTCFKPCLKTDP